MARKKANKSQKIPRSKVMVIRLTLDEHKQVKQTAKEAGKSMSTLCRAAILGVKLHYRLTDKQCEAFCTLADARADLVNIRSALKDAPDELKIKLFRKKEFMQEWLMGIDEIAQKCEMVLLENFN